LKGSLFTQENTVRSTWDSSCLFRNKPRLL